MISSAEDRAVEDVLHAEQEMREGKGIRGDLRTIIARVNNMMSKIKIPR